MNLRDGVMSSLNSAVEFYSRCKGAYHKVKELGLLCRYTFQVQGCRKPKAMDVSDLVNKWVEVIAKMSVAHVKDDYDGADAQTEELLGPILTAPVKQVREFYDELIQKMAQDKRVPWIVRIGFEAWGEVVVKNAQDDGVKRLKNRLAGEIAELVEMDIREQIPEAIKRALRWRNTEALEAIKEQLELGVKPKLKGRESCLFLELGRGTNKKRVML